MPGLGCPPYLEKIQGHWKHTLSINQVAKIEWKSKAPEKGIAGGWGRGLCAGNYTDLTDNIQSDSNGFQSQPISSARTAYISLR